MKVIGDYLFAGGWSPGNVSPILAVFNSSYIGEFDRGDADLYSSTRIDRCWASEERMKNWCWWGDAFALDADIWTRARIS